MLWTHTVRSKCSFISAFIYQTIHVSKWHSTETHTQNCRCQAEPVAKCLPHPRLSKVNCRRHVKKTVWRQSIFKNKVHLNSMQQIGFINSLQQLLKKQSQSMSSCVIWLPELEGLIKPSTLGKKNLVTALLSHASSRHNEISLRLSETLSSDWHEITLAKRQLRLVYFFNQISLSI